MVIIKVQESKREKAEKLTILHDRMCLGDIRQSTQDSYSCLSSGSMSALLPSKHKGKMNEQK